MCSGVCNTLSTFPLAVIFILVNLSQTYEIARKVNSVGLNGSNKSLEFLIWIIIEGIMLNKEESALNRNINMKTKLGLEQELFELQIIASHAITITHAIHHPNTHLHHTPSFTRSLLEIHNL